MKFIILRVDTFEGPLFYLYVKKWWGNSYKGFFSSQKEAEAEAYRLSGRQYIVKEFEL